MPDSEKLIAAAQIVRTQFEALTTFAHAGLAGARTSGDVLRVAFWERVEGDLCAVGAELDSLPEPPDGQAVERARQ